jgi:hypothetical protein
LHIRPRPSFWLGWAGNSLTGASCASIPNLADPMHLRMSVMASVLSLADAHLASRRTSITLFRRRCKPNCGGFVMARAACYPLTRAPRRRFRSRRCLPLIASTVEIAHGDARRPSPASSAVGGMLL